MTPERVLKDCALCAHVYQRNGKQACGTQKVVQNFCVDARSSKGDCGPSGVHFLTLSFGKGETDA